MSECPPFRKFRSPNGETCPFIARTDRAAYTQCGFQTKAADAEATGSFLEARAFACD